MNNIVITMKALADETRFSLLCLLLKHDYCVGSLSRQLGITESAVSQHLKVLREASLVNKTKRGYFTHYGVDREQLAELGKTLERLANTPNEKPQCNHMGKKHHTCHKGGSN